MCPLFRGRVHWNYYLFEQVLAVCKIRFPFSFFMRSLYCPNLHAPWGHHEGWKLLNYNVIHYNLSAEGRRSLNFGGYTPMSKLTWVDRKHHELLSPRGARVLNFSTMIHPLSRKEIPMEAILERCCGIDVHKKTITACLMVGKPQEKPKKTVRTFTTMTRDF